MREILKKLLNTYGATGREDAIRRTIREMVEPYVDEIEEDALGNLVRFVLLPGQRFDTGDVPPDVEHDGRRSGM